MAQFYNLIINNFLFVQTFLLNLFKVVMNNIICNFIYNVETYHTFDIWALIILLKKSCYSLVNQKFQKYFYI